MTIGIVGLGLIGGSLAKAYKQAGLHVIGYDKDEAIMGFAKLAGAIDAFLDDDSLPSCDVIFVAINPAAARTYLTATAPKIGQQALVFDCCGIKRAICEPLFPIAARHGFTFVGAHPMAGSHKGGFKNSRADLFHGASMIIVPPVYDDAALFGRIEDALRPVGFGQLTVATAEHHDELIAFSSQMAHVVSNAFIKSKSAGEHKGFSAGSYKDLTRVARLDAAMWTELFMANADYLAEELRSFVAEIEKYQAALATGDHALMHMLLEEGSRRKEEAENV